MLLLHVAASEYKAGSNGREALALVGAGVLEVVQQSPTPYRDACRRLGLLHDEFETEALLQEAINTNASKHKMLELFTES